MAAWRVVVAALLGAALVGGCSGDPEPAPAPAPSPATSSPRPLAAVPDEPATVVATAVVDVVEVRGRPDAAEPTERTLDRRDETSGQLVFVVDAQQGEWLQVLLPVRPNGSTGWIRASDVSLATNPFAVRVSLSDHELTVTDGTREVLRTAVGVGTTDTPTPGGRYYLKELLQPPTPDGPYGPYAYGLSGFSNVLTDFAGGEGVIGIHGTDAPDLVGTDVSNGCLRLANDVVVRLVEEIGLPLGTPVVIQA
jgi:lipoprotein-anchoring transpeptidase ErfK/SrfK